MKQFFIQNSDKYSLTSDKAIQIHQTLPVGVYEVQLHPMMGYFLTEKPQRPLPAKLYGTLEARAQRILQSYWERARMGLGTGVLLSGEKGSGKTLLARHLMDVINLPTVVVSKPYHDAGFLDLLSQGGSKLVLFDEFEKVYDGPDMQHALLSMLDGHYATTNLTIATLNDRYKLVDALKNRPSRFYYHYRYEQIEREFIEQYCKDRLHNCTDQRLAGINEITTLVLGFNFDMLQVLVEEMNRFNESAQECMKHINVMPTDLYFEYSVSMTTAEGENIPLQSDKARLKHMRPEMMDFMVYVVTGKKKEPKAVYIDGSECFAGQDDKGRYMFKPADCSGVIVYLHTNRTNLSWAL